MQAESELSGAAGAEGVPAGGAGFRILREFYESHLLEHIMPFWLGAPADRQWGGVMNTLTMDGSVLATEKYLWSQGRWLWTLSALCRHIEDRTLWRQLAEQTAKFLLENGRDADGAWHYELSREGTVREGPRSVYADAFVIYGLTEFAALTGSEQALCAAMEGFRRTRPLLDNHSTLATEPHPIPVGFQSHGPLMIFALVYFELGRVAGNEMILNASLVLAERIVREHLKPDQRLLREFVRPGGGVDESTDAGCTIVPGHAIESMWFLERIFRYFGRNRDADLALESMLWHLDLGWDDTCGGIFLAIHTREGAPLWHHPDAKVWWPHTEALYGFLRAFEATNGSRFLEAFRRVHDYTFATFPEWEHGEWRHNLDRAGTPTTPVIASLPVKDPFHLPRSLIYSVLTLRKLEAEKPT